MKNRISENKPIEQIRDESAQVYCDPDTQRVYRNGFDAAIQLCEQRERDLIQALEWIKKLDNNPFNHHEDAARCAICHAIDALKKLRG